VSKEKVTPYKIHFRHELLSSTSWGNTTSQRY